MKGFVFLIAMVVLSMGVSPVKAEESPFQSSGLPLPRYVSLASNEVNVRAGPGLRYPIEWIYTKKFLPVEIVREFEHWREIRDFQGQSGWVHKSLLSGQRSVLVTGGMRLLRRKPSGNAMPVVQLESGVIGLVEKCAEGWCRVDIAGYDGWLRIAEIWGIKPDEVVN